MTLIWFEYIELLESIYLDPGRYRRLVRSGQRLFLASVKHFKYDYKPKRKTTLSGFPLCAFAPLITDGLVILWPNECKTTSSSK